MKREKAYPFLVELAALALALAFGGDSDLYIIGGLLLFLPIYHFARRRTNLTEAANK